MINIAITAGGTSENMDGVRKITNISTGQLGWHCLEAILDYMLQSDTEDFHVHYLLTETAARKTLNENQQKFVSFIEVTDAESVFKAVDKLTKETCGFWQGGVENRNRLLGLPATPALSLL